MKAATKPTKKAIQYDDTNVPGGYCMSGKFITPADKVKLLKIIAANKAKQPKSILQKIFS